MQDRNFDDIAEKFSRNIYGTTKGQLRQAILWQDLDRVAGGNGPAKTACAGCWRWRRADRNRKWPSAGIRSFYAIFLRR